MLSVKKWKLYICSCYNHVATWWSHTHSITQYTRLLTVLITLVQGSGYLALLANTPGAIDPSVNKGIFFLGNSIILSTGTIFAMWLGEKITDRGIGNGISLLIMIGIIATLPRSFVGEIQAQLANSGLPVRMSLDAFTSRQSSQNFWIPIQTSQPTSLCSIASWIW